MKYCFRERNGSTSQVSKKSLQLKLLGIPHNMIFDRQTLEKERRVSPSRSRYGARANTSLWKDHQKAWVYSDGQVVLQNKTNPRKGLSYNNMLDADAPIALV